MTKRIVLLQALASTLTDLGYILAGLDSSADGVGVKAGSWTVRDVLAHLLYVERQYQARLKRVIEEDNPTVVEIRPDDTPFDDSGSTAELLEQFKVARSHTLTTLKALSPGQWQRPAVHERTGKTTLRFLMQLLIEHDIEHLNQIVEAQQAARAIPVRDAQPAVEKSHESNQTK
jgi:uncharacterized damage-inducible protein DinB